MRAEDDHPMTRPVKERTRSSLSDEDYMLMLLHVLQTLTRTAIEKGLFSVAAELKAFSGTMESLFQNSEQRKRKADEAGRLQLS
jgi:hypothetical protein